MIMYQSAGGSRQKQEVEYFPLTIDNISRN